MGCPTKIELGTNAVFSICTHATGTGVLTDADFPPIYRVYEDLTAVPILTGVMAKLDDVNTTGFYAEQIACTIANGFEDGRAYTVYIEATVLGDRGGICYGFQAWTRLGYTTTQADQRNSADEMLNRDIAGGASGGLRIVRDAFRLLRNFRQILAGTLTVYREDDATPAWTAAVSTSPGNPVIKIDPV
jgi:hypothetical protein